MFPARYFAPRYFAPRYWPKLGAELTPQPPEPQQSVGGGFYPARKRKRTAPRPKSLRDIVSEVVDQIIAEQERPRRAPPSAEPIVEAPERVSPAPGTATVDLDRLLGDLQGLKLDLAALEIAGLRRLVEERIAAMQAQEDEDIMILLLATM